jgi:hypothetical protein
MKTFREYVDRRDETSFNPMPYGGGGLAQTALGVAASPIALASGLGQLMPQASGYKAFEPARDFLLNLNRENPEWRPYLTWVLKAAEDYIQTQKPTEIAGVTMGRQAGMASRVAAGFGKLLKAAWVSLRNVAHTISNVDPGVTDKIGPQVQAMLRGLDSIPKDRALDRINEFRQRLQAGAGSETIDSDARIHKPFSIFGK